MSLPGARLIVSMALGLFLLTTLSFAQAAASRLPDISPEGWSQLTTYHDVMVDRYMSESGKIDLHLLALPPTDKPADVWLKEIVEQLFKPYSDAGITYKHYALTKFDTQADSIRLMEDNPELTLISGIVVVEQLYKGKTSIFTLRAKLEPGQAIQVSINTNAGMPSAEGENEQSIALSNKAVMPLSRELAESGMEQMLKAMTYDFIYAVRNKPTVKSAESAESAESDRTDKTAKIPVANNGNDAPRYKVLPGPRIKYTGKELDSLPAGYRFHTEAKNYWTNNDMTATRTLTLSLTKDGQFSKSRFAIAGSAAGAINSIGVVSQSSKHGSSSSVSGSLNGGETGASSVTLTKRDDLDPGKYGTYYIEGRHIEFRYANGNIKKYSFTSDGYNYFMLDGAKYFSSGIYGWTFEKQNAKKTKTYRSMDGAYSVNVIRLNKKVKDGKKDLISLLEPLRKNGHIEIVKNIEVKDHGKYKYYTARFKYIAADFKGNRIRDIIVRDSKVKVMLFVTRYHGDEKWGSILKLMEKV